jgi:hypothetical protein
MKKTLRLARRLGVAAVALVAALAACAPAAGPPRRAPDGQAAPGQPVVVTPPVAAPASAPVALPASAPAVDPATLPQTRARPAASGAVFEARARALWDAVANDDPERGMAAFFPVGAYRQVKAVADPARDWNRRLVAAYRRDLHALRLQLGRRAAGARLVGLVVPEKRARWVEPGEEWNRIGYWRVLGSRLEYELDGRRRSFPVTSLISWRGEWYVVHLAAFK